ncbi:hypothetical protein EIP86_004884 [Pleurotus ostreatoroseus]|nr:hypothetical protein EIP86_004884 [Pleurotus ostreatoroseus]
MVRFAQLRTDCRSSRLRRWTPRTSSRHSRRFSRVSCFGSEWRMLVTDCVTLDIYRIVSSKSLEQSADPIKPSTGDNILVTPSVDPQANQSGKCC